MIDRLLLVRHGQTDHNVERRLQGGIDIPMNEVGRRQARTVAASLAHLTDVAGVYSSPLSRAIDTAHAIASPHGIDVNPDPRLIERSFGQWEGLTRDEVQEGWPAEYAQWEGGHPIRGAGVESRHDVATRLDAALQGIVHQHDGGTAIVVSHGAAITIAITTALGLDPEHFRAIQGMNNCSRAELIPYTNPNGGWMRLTSLNIPANFPDPQTPL